MPIPLILLVPALLAVAGGGTAIAIDAMDRIDTAKQRCADRRKRYEAAMRKHQEKIKDVASRFEDFGRSRLEAFVTLGKAAESIGNAKVKKRDLFEKFNITPEQLVQLQKASIHAQEILEGSAAALGSGVATAAAAYGLVGTLASASTGAAISTLSGAAASNATLAWLGGGTLAAGGGGIAAGTVVLGGLVVGPLLLVGSIWAQTKAGNFENQIEEDIAKMDIHEANMRKVAAGWDAALARVTELRESTIKLKNELASVLSSSPQVHLCPLRFPVLRRRGCRTCDCHTYQVAKVAQSLGQLLDIAILDKEGRII